ncbi:AMP-binding protein, partial [Rheinheimera sp. 4Y26]
GFVAASTGTERRLCELWQQLLGVERVGVSDNFFALGGHSLLAAIMANRLEQAFGGKNLTAAILANPVLSQLALYLDQHQGDCIYQDIVPAETPLLSSPLSFAQQRLWFMQQFSTDDRLFHMPAVFRVEGTLDLNRMRQALQAVIADHAILRSQYHQGEDLPYFTITEDVHFDIQSLRLPVAHLAEPEFVRLCVSMATDLPFRLDQDLLIRAFYIETLAAETSNYLVFDLHHLIADGYSLHQLVRYLRCYYQSPDQPLLSGPSLQYTDYIRWQQAMAGSGRVEEAKLYWRQLLNELPQDHGLIGHPAAVPGNSADNSYSHSLDLATADRLRALLVRVGTTPFVFMQTCLALLIGRLSGRTDVVLGSPEAGRQHARLEPLLGLFINPQLYRTQFSDNPGFTSLLKRLHAQHLASAQHNFLPFEEIVTLLNPVRQADVAPLFQIMLNFNQYPVTDIHFPDLTLQQCAVQQLLPSKYDITLYVEPRVDGRYHLLWHFDPQRFSQADIRFYANELSYEIQQVLAAPDVPVLQLGWQAPVPQAIAPLQFADSCNPYQRIMQFVSQTPSAAALSFQQRSLDYAALDLWVSQLAQLLVQHGVAARSRVVVGLPRSELRVAVILAVQKLAACYIPLSEELPPERNSYMLTQSLPDLFVTTPDSVFASLADTSSPVLMLDAARLQQLQQFDGQCAVNQPAPSDLACIIYTSGTTGLPKGVGVNYLALHNRIDWMLQTWPFAAQEQAVHITSMAFIRGVWELFVPLCAGAHLHLCEREHVREVPRLIDYLQRHRIQRVVTAPSLLRVLTEELSNRQLTLPLKYWFVSGEPLLQQYVNMAVQALPDCQFVNLYGSTEVMSDVLFKPVSVAAHHNWVAAGKPITGVSVWIADTLLQQVPAGVVGEIMAGGAAVCHGYWRDEEMSRHKFIQLGDARFFRTGDLGYQTPDGEIVCLGRNDDQIKLRGQRIALGEVCQAISELDDIRQVVVLPLYQHTEQACLVAYVIPSGRHALPEQESKVRQQLAQRLPSYCLPSAFVWLEAFPLKANGKVDKSALPLPQHISTEVLVLPANSTERLLLQIWADVLRQEESRISVMADFFHLGGNSLLLNRIIQRIRQQWHIELKFKVFFQNSSIRAVADVLQVELATQHSQQAATEKKKLLIL